MQPRLTPFFFSKKLDMKADYQRWDIRLIPAQLDADYPAG